MCRRQDGRVCGDMVDTSSLRSDRLLLRFVLWTLWATRSVVHKSTGLAVRLAQVEGPERETLQHYVTMIQLQRGDFNGRMITIRAEDLRAIACLFGVTPDAMSRRLDELGLRVTS